MGHSRQEQFEALRDDAKRRDSIELPITAVAILFVITAALWWFVT